MLAGGTFTADASPVPSRAREEEPFPRADGKIDWIKWEIRPWYEEQGGIGGIILFSENVSERKQSEEHRRHSDALYRQVVELCLEAIWVHKAGRIMFANEAAARLFGFDQPADMVGRSNFELVHPDDRERAMNCTSAMTGTRNAAPLTEMKFLGANGRPIVLQVRASPFLHEGEVAIMAVGRDLTERIEAAGVLRESEARFQALANTLPAPMWMSNEEGECIFVNNSWLTYTGRPLEEELGQGFAEDIHPEQRAATMALEPAMVRSRQPVNAEYQLRNKDGRYRWFVDYAVPRFSDDGRYLGHVGVLIDVDDRRLLEAKMKTIVESTVDGIITISQAGTILTFSGSAERIFGYKEHEVVGHNVSMLMPDPDRSRHNSYIHNYLNTGIAKIIGIGREVRGLRKDGSVFPMDLAVGELRTTDEEREFVGTVRDISVRRQLEDQLRQTQKIEAVGQLTGGIAHDFNNLLGVIVGNLDDVLEHVDGESESGKMIHRALNGALHGAELTHRLLAFARQQQLEPKGFSINEMLPDIAGDFETDSWGIDRDTHFTRRRSVARICRPFASPGCSSQFGDQCPRCHARGRDAHNRNGKHPIRRSVLQSQSRSQTRRLCHARHIRHGSGNVIGGCRARFRTLLHDEADGSGNGAGP